MTNFEALSPDYQISQEDCDSAYKIFADTERYSALSNEQKAAVDVLVDSLDVQRKVGRWPTVRQVYEHWQAQRFEEEQKRLNSWQSAYRFTQKDFDTLVTNDCGPLFEFVSVAKTLKSTRGHFPTVGEVRAAIKQVLQ